MYSNKESVNILTALLISHGIRHAVVCPGSRNAPIVHNLNECVDIKCHAVTDERSAGFYALGMAQALSEPVVVCVTSGTALLNVLPAVAEAWYQHQPLIIVSADRPQQWIGQLDGQTLPQPDALGRFVCQAVSLPEIPMASVDMELRWHCNRLVNEALLTAKDNSRPVHINVPISEPLFTFNVSSLPDERTIVRYTPPADYGILPIELVDGLVAAQRPMIVFGQSNPNEFEGDGVDWLFSHVIVLHEALSPFPSVSHFDEVLFQGKIEHPDFILYIGDCIVSKRLRHFLRNAEGAVTWRVSRSGDIEDTFQNLRGLVVGDADFVLQSLNEKMRNRSFAGKDYRRQWLHLLKQAGDHALSYEPHYSQMAAVREFENQLNDINCTVHYANSSAIRLANIYAAHHVWCNRGVNGIEGSLSTACGCSLVSQGRVYCIIGDLSFFYDQNAFWNQELTGNLRVLLLNNGCGGIFRQLSGLAQSPAADRFVSARHHTTAEGICSQNNISYQTAHDTDSLCNGINWLLSHESDRPMLLEVLTDADDDALQLENYYKSL